MPPDHSPPGQPPGQSQRPAQPPAKAVALEYSHGTDVAPRITATGEGAVAEAILQIALDHGVKVREDADLVEILSMLDVDSLIPLEAFAAVAEILSYIYRAEQPLPPAPKPAP